MLSRMELFTYTFVNDKGNRSQTLSSFGLLLRSRVRTVLETPDGVSEPIAYVSLSDM